jgi:hypothetical protein
MMPRTPAMGRPKATAAMLSVMGCISSSTPTAGTRPMLIANTGLNYRVWLRDGLESRTLGACVRPELPIVPRASFPQLGVVRAFQGGIYGI